MRIAVAGGTGTVGRYVVAHAQKTGHEVVVLSRSRGVDVRSGEHLADALNGADVVIDVTHPDTIEQKAATGFWTEVAAAVQRTGAEQGVRHIVTLSIVGIEKTSFGYYAAKLEHERAAASGPVPSTVMRATQFHELPAQLIAITRHDSQAHVLDMRPVQTVAARTVAEVLLELAEAAPVGRARDLAGPQEADLVALARAFVQHRGEAITVYPDSQSVAGIPPRALLPEYGARIQGPTFEEWLASDDAAALPILCPWRRASPAETSSASAAIAASLSMPCVTRQRRDQHKGIDREDGCQHGRRDPSRLAISCFVAYWPPGWRLPMSAWVVGRA